MVRQGSRCGGPVVGQGSRCGGAVVRQGSGHGGPVVRQGSGCGCPMVRQQVGIHFAKCQQWGVPACCLCHSHSSSFIQDVAPV